MRRFIVGLVLGVFLASGSAYGYSQYWEESGRSYKCSGIPTGVACRETNYYRSQQYEVMIVPSAIIVSYGGKPIYDCTRKHRPAYNCVSYVPAP